MPSIFAMLRFYGGVGMNPARNVIDKFGGQSALARLIDRDSRTVHNWARTGVIPAKWQGRLLNLARERNVNLSTADFFGDSLPPRKKNETGKPFAEWPGFLEFGDREVPCFVLNTKQRVISRKGATGVLTGNKGGGNLESYLNIQALQPFLPPLLEEQFIEFELAEYERNNLAKGMTAETFIDVCAGYVKAWEAGALTTETQIAIAQRAGMFLAGCAKVGLIALIDEATGYQYERAQDALKVKLKLFLEEEMRKWEKTFPDQLWVEFGRLTGWKGKAQQRPKYWGKLVMELVYDYLDPDVADWLRQNAPAPQHGQNYHQWLSNQYGLRRLIEHLWMLIGMSSACGNLSELRRKMAEKFGRIPVQYTLYLPPGEVQ